MKKFIILLMVFSSQFTYAQNGKVYLKNGEIIPGKENIYIYEPPKGLNVPENALAKIVYNRTNITSKTIPLVKSNTHYEFKLQVPDSIDVLILSIVAKGKTLVDNHSGKGFIVYLKHKTEKELQNAKLSQVIISSYANFELKLTISNDEMIEQYANLYKINPAMKEDRSYLSYLFMNYQKDNNKYQPLLIAYAEKLTSKGDENSLITASRCYYILKMKDKVSDIEQISMQKYPNGQIAQNNFFREFYQQKDKTEPYILEKLKEYIIKFKDSSDNSKDQFYSIALSLFVKVKDTLNIEKYESLIKNKMIITNIYNDFAWQSAGEDLESPGKDLDLAEKLGAKAVQFTKDRMEHPKTGEESGDFQGTYNNLSDTYALVLYKQKKYELAFAFQQPIAEQDELDQGGKERFAAYAEKVKGQAFTKEYLEKQLISGNGSKTMTSQLQRIYKSMGLPENEFEKIKASYLLSSDQKNKEAIIKKYGALKAINFTLTDADAKKNQLSDFTGKLIVLDFWATWCGPCRASMPKMQELVTKYKDNEHIAFFFIDTWEDDKPNEVQKKVAAFLLENKYSIHVLFDFKDEVVGKYKVNGIPTKIVIDKKGEIIAIDPTENSLTQLLEDNSK